MSSPRCFHLCVAVASRAMSSRVGTANFIISLAPFYGRISMMGALLAFVYINFHVLRRSSSPTTTRRTQKAIKIKGEIENNRDVVGSASHLPLRLRGHCRRRRRRRQNWWRFLRFESDNQGRREKPINNSAAPWRFVSTPGVECGAVEQRDDCFGSVRVWWNKKWFVTCKWDEDRTCRMSQ